MSSPVLYLGSDLIVSGHDVSFNAANVTVKAPVTDLNVANKVYVDVADAKLLSASSRSVIVPLTTSIVGGQAFPTVMSSSVAELGYDGWYYKKTLNDSVNNKVNWYFAPDVNMTVDDLQQLFFQINLINATSVPFITIYTKPTGTGDAASWYKSKRTYDMASILAGNTNYCCFIKLNANTPDPVAFNHINQSLTLSTVATSNKGTFDASEQILFIAFASDSSAAIGNVEFICRSVNIQSAKGTINLLLSNIHVESKALSSQVNSLYQYFFKANRDAIAIV
jgi:hypothetical protein